MNFKSATHCFSGAKFVLTILCLTASFVISSCVAVVVAGAAAGLVVYDRRSFSMIESDTRILYHISKEIAADPHFSGSHIVISSFNQVVLLTGQTPAASLRVVAEKIARNTSQVVRVYNQITLQSPTPFKQRGRDSWITSQIRTSMMAKKGLQSGSIRVLTENNVVYLMGVVTREQASLAVEVARQIQGISQVVKVFRYTA
jgi:osmotically-inducible protein OsmY